MVGHNLPPPPPIEKGLAYLKTYLGKAPSFGVTYNNFSILENYSFSNQIGCILCPTMPHSLPKQKTFKVMYLTICGCLEFCICYVTFWLLAKVGNENFPNYLFWREKFRIFRSSLEISDGQTFQKFKNSYIYIKMYSMILSIQLHTSNAPKEIKN